MSHACSRIVHVMQMYAVARSKVHFPVDCASINWKPRSGTVVEELRDTLGRRTWRGGEADNLGGTYKAVGCSLCRDTAGSLPG